MSHIWVFEWKTPKLPTPRKARQVKSKYKSRLFTFLYIKEFILAGQIINSPYYCDVLLENVQRLHPKIC
jgi:hypothetical protein